jgi:NAD-dependent deacetylase
MFKDIEGLDAVVDLMKTRYNIVIVTGAGVSTDSGIPDYRSNKGLYRDKADLFSLDNFNKDRTGFMEKMNEIFKDRVPNEVHDMISQMLLSTKSNVTKLYTQNIDGLHTKSYLNVLQGISKTENILKGEYGPVNFNNIREIHGSFKYVNCTCTPDHRIREEIVKTIDGRYVCNWCNSEDAMPDIVFFGMEPKLTDVDRDNLADADLVIFLGTTGEVSTVEDIFNYTPGATRVSINRGPEYIDNCCDLSIHEDLNKALKYILERVGK